MICPACDLSQVDEDGVPAPCICEIEEESDPVMDRLDWMEV